MFRTDATLASSNSKSTKCVIPGMEHEDFRSSTEVTISNSLIHGIASVGKFEQEQCLNLKYYLPTRKRLWSGEVGRHDFPKILSCCWSTPSYSKFLRIRGLDEFPFNELGNIGVAIVSLTRSPLSTTSCPVFALTGILSQLGLSMGRVFWDKVSKSMQVNLHKHFVVYHAYPKYQAADFWRGSAVLPDQLGEEVMLIHWERGIMVHCAPIRHL